MSRVWPAHVSYDSHSEVNVGFERHMMACHGHMMFRISRYTDRVSGCLTADERQTHTETATKISRRTWRSMMKNMVGKTFGALAAVLVAATFAVPSAQADVLAWVNSGDVNNSRIDGSWAYNWTKSQATSYSKTSAGANARACQDGVCSVDSTTKMHDYASISRAGKASNRNDSASVW